MTRSVAQNTLASETISAVIAECAVNEVATSAQPTGGSSSITVYARSPAVRLEFRSMRTLPLSEVKAKLSGIAEEVDRTHERVLVTKNGRDYVVLLSADDLESIEATMELLADPEAQERLREADSAIARGDVVNEAQARAMLADRRTSSAS